MRTNKTVDYVDVDSTHTQWISYGVILATLLDHMNSIHVLGVIVFLRVRNRIFQHDQLSSDFASHSVTFHIL